ncbi:MAG: 30S ribosomal protein S27e [Candidatus Diapherotrites archaeon]|nr:30S ribosomal protein S27e [Candidatus Diapherotrites archaeon]
MDYAKYIPHPKTKFLRVKCSGCGNEQIIFSAPATSKVKCLVCEKDLAESTGSKLKLKSKVISILE